MGLDIYLYRYEDRAETERKENEYETVSDKNWSDAGPYDTLSEDAKTAIREKNKQAAINLGLESDGEDSSKERVEIDSAIDKEHYFKIGYFRSSYNGGGIERVLKNLDVPGLHEIFQPDGEYVFQPDWEAALARVESSISILQGKGNYRCFSVSSNMFSSGEGMPADEKQALDCFLKQLDQEHFGEGGYSNKDGHFYLKEPLQVFGIIPGTYDLLGVRPCTYIVMKGENEWYITALQIVKETIEYVLSKPDKEKYYLHWSG